MQTITRDETVAANEGLVVRVVQSLRGILEAFRVDRDDALQEGRLALIQAAERFDAGKGFPFGAYAGRVIRHAVLFYAREGSVIRVPRTMQKLHGIKPPKVHELGARDHASRKDWNPDRLSPYMADALRTLPAERRDLFVRYAMGDRPVDAAYDAALMRPAADNYFRRDRTALRKHLEGKCKP